MIRVVKLSGKYYGYEIDLDEGAYKYDEDVESIRQFASEGVPVIIVDDLEVLETLDIFDKVEMVKPEEN